MIQLAAYFLPKKHFLEILLELLQTFHENLSQMKLIEC